MDARPRGRVREIQSSRPGCAKDCCNLGPCVWASFGFMQVCSRPACPDARHHRLLLTAAVGVDVLLQRRYVSVPAQGVNLLRVWRLAEENKGFAVGLGGAEPSQVAARGEVVIQGRRQRGLLAYLKQEAKLKGCRNKSLHRITSGSRLPSLGELGSSGLNRTLTKDHSKYHPKNKARSFRYTKAHSHILILGSSCHIPETQHTPQH